MDNHECDRTAQYEARDITTLGDKCKKFVPMLSTDNEVTKLLPATVKVDFGPLDEVQAVVKVGQMELVQNGSDFSLRLDGQEVRQVASYRVECDADRIPVLYVKILLL